MQPNGSSGEGVVKGAQVLACAADRITEVIEEAGGDPERVLGVAGIHLETLSNPLNEIDLRAYCGLLNEAARQTQTPHFGLHYGQPFLPTRAGPIGFLTISAPTLLAGVRALCAFFPLQQENSIVQLRSAGPDLELVYEVREERVDLRQDAEFTLMVFTNFFRHALGPIWSPLAVEFAHSEPEGSDQHQTAFGAPVFFDMPTNCIRFRRGALHTTMPSADPQLHGIMQEVLRQRMSPSRDSGPTARPGQDFVDTVRSLIVDQMDDGPNLEQTAKQLFMSSATLYRRLRDVGIHFNELVRTTRRDLALDLLKDGGLSLTDISTQLGYSELSAFSRAFRQWLGMSPAQYRTDLNGTSAVDARL